MLLDSFDKTTICVASEKATSALPTLYSVVVYTCEKWALYVL